MSPAEGDARSRAYFSTFWRPEVDVKAGTDRNVMSILELVLPLIGVLAGVALGPIFADRQERKRWHRQKQYDAARAVTSAARAVLWRSDEVGSDRDDGDMEMQKDAVRDAIFTLREHLADVEFLFGGSVRSAAMDLENQFGNELAPYVFDLSTKADGQAQEVVEARLRMTEFHDAARGAILQGASLKRRLGALFVSSK